MSIYMTEQEQLQAIKKWWDRYSSAITMTASIVLLVFAGYKYWNWHQDKINQEASNAYEHLMVSFSNQDNKSVRAYANQLLKEYEDTVYADAGRLTLAKLFVGQAKTDKAKEQLQYVATHSKMTALKQVAKIRLARLFTEEKFFDKALAELDQVADPAYTPAINEVKGDILAATGHYSEAIASYRKAINDDQTKGMGNLFLEMKANELAALSQAAINTNNKPLQSA